MDEMKTTPEASRGRRLVLALARPGATLGRRAMANPLLTLTLVGLVFYAIVRLSYDFYYSSFGLEPEDVGLGYADTISRAATIIVTAPFLLMLGIGLVMALGLCLWIGDDRPLLAGGLTAAFVYWGIATVIAVVTLCVDSAWRLADGVESGDPSPKGVIDIGVHPRLVEVAWFDEAPPTLADVGEHRTVLIGANDGTTFLYDATDCAMLRIPSGTITLTDIDDDDVAESACS